MRQKTYTNRQITTGAIRDLVAAGIDLPPLQISIADSRTDTADIMLQVSWGGRSYPFVGECKARWTPKETRSAAADLKRRAAVSGRYPLLVVPYLNDEALRILQAQDVSGVDLSGNGVVIIPGEVLVYRTGSPSRFKQSFGLVNVYRGKISLVARAFLLRASYDTVNDVHRAVRSRGTQVALSTVSKVLKRLDDDLITNRAAGTIRVLQPDELLNRLAQEYRPVQVSNSLTAQIRGVTTEEFIRKLTEVASFEAIGLAATGAGSAARYAIAAREKTLDLYCSDLRAVRRELHPFLEETSRFPHIRLYETEDAQPYFDVRPGGTIPWASPIQTYLELMQGDARDQEAAQQVREQILAQLAETDG